MNKLIQKIFFIIIFNTMLFATTSWNETERTSTDYFSLLSDRSLVFDSGDRAHIIYGGDHLYHGHQGTLSWETDILDMADGVGNFASLAIDSNDNLYIAYGDKKDQAIKFLYCDSNGSLGTPVTVDKAEDVYEVFSDFRTSIAVDSSAKAHIVYQDYSGLYYNTVLSGIAGTPQLLDDNIVDHDNIFASVSVDGNDKMHIVYCDGVNNDLKYFYQSSGAAIQGPITLNNDCVGGLGGVAVSVDKINTLHIVFKQSDALSYMSISSGGVSSPLKEVDSYGIFPSVSAGSAVHISYLSSGLKHVSITKDGTVSTPQNLTSGVGSYSSISVDSLGNPHFAYIDSSLNALVYDDTVQHTGNEPGLHSSIAYDSNGSLHRCYYDNASQDLWYQEIDKEGRTLQYKRLERDGDVGGHCSIALDAEANSYISYYSSLLVSVKYIRVDADGRAGTPIVIESGGGGAYSRIALDSHAKAHIVYYDYTWTRLRYATVDVNGVVSAPETLDGQSSDIATSFDVAVDSSDRVHVAYSDITDRHIKHLVIQTDGTKIPLSMIDSSMSGTFTVALVVDTDDNAHIVYSSSSSNALKYTMINRNNNFILDHSELDQTSQDMKQITALCIDNTNRLHIAYIDANNRKLKYISGKNSVWKTPEIVGDTVLFQQRMDIAASPMKKIAISYFDDFDHDLVLTERALSDDNLIPVIYYLLN